MRITTQMLKTSAKDAGLSLNVSLLKYVKRNDGQTNSLLSILDSKNGSLKSVEGSSTTYKKMEQAADFLERKLELFISGEKEESIFDRAREKGDNEEIHDGVKKLVESYNDMLKALKSDASTLNAYYRKTLESVTEDNRETLDNIGITVAKDGTLIINEEKLKKADTDALEEVLGNSKSFTGKMAFVVEKIEDNAKANIESLSSRYDSMGNAYSATLNRYNFFG